jgi:catechol 2,3-dioxygenase-like lactoylglutathione lyase family enzyme
MTKFSASALTHLLVVSDAQASRDWYVRVLDASVYAEYGETSVVLELLGNWLLLVTGGEPTEDKPTVTFGPPRDLDYHSCEIIFRVGDCRATHQLLQSRGAEFLTEPVDWGSEVRAFFRDLDGHLFEISELTGRRS